MRYFFFGLTYLSLVVLGSCSAYRYIDIQILKPAEIKIPSKINSIFLLNHKVFIKDNDSTLADPVYYKLFEDSFHKKIVQELTKSPRLDSAVFIINNYSNLKKLNDSLPARNKTSFLVLKMDSIAIKDSIYGEFIFDQEDPTIVRGMTGILELYYSVNIKLFELNKNILFDSYNYTDTLFWAIDTDHGIDDMKKLHNLQLPVCQAAEQVSQYYSKHICPMWVTEERILITYPSYRMHQAFGKFKHHDLEEAQKVWKKAFLAGPAYISSIAAHNVAVVYEMLDNLQECEEWLLKSQEIHPRKLTLKYLEKIKERKFNKAELDKQLFNY